MSSPLQPWPDVFFYPPLVAVVLWAGLTALVAGLNRRSPWPGRVALVASLPLLALAHQELRATAAAGDIAGAYGAFLAGTTIWAWHELAFYSGVLTGPWRAPCPPQTRGIKRLGYALGTHIYHELAVIAELALMLWLLRDGWNFVGPLVFVLSWAQQHSAKLNVFLGVPTLNVELFPPHLRYLGSYWRRRAPSGLFIPTTSAFTMLAALLWLAAHAHRLEPAGVRLALLAALCSLGALEHWLLAFTAMRKAAHSRVEASIQD
jgi:putative photosynthetic complex assembly protein 2